jgi:formate dehydrogenase alpha subunit
VLHSYQGRVVRVDSETEKGLNLGNLCVKGRFGIGYSESPDRLTTPLVRNSDGALEIVSWDDALRYVTEKMKSVLAAKGGQAVGAICGTHCTNEAGYLLQKLMRAVIGSNNVDAIDHAESSASAAALGEALGGSAATNSRRDLEQADVILLVGADLTESHPVLALELIKAVRRGKTLIVVDPRRTELAAKASLHLAVKPGTDLALLRAMMRHVLDMGLIDSEFVEARTEGFATLQGMLRAVDVSIEAATCGIDADLVREAAAAFGKAPAAATILGTGVARGPKAEATAAALAYLALMTGNIGRPGTGLIPLRSGANSQGLADMGVRPDSLPGGSPVSSPEAVSKLEAAWGVALNALGRGGSVGDMLAASKTGGVEVLYVVGADPALAVADEKTARALLDTAGFVVVQDSFLSDTAAYADVVLPSAVTCEDEGTFTNGERLVQRVRAATPGNGESQPDWAVVQAIANRLGADWSYQGPADIMREIAEIVPAYQGISYAGLEEDGVQTPFDGRKGAGVSILYQDGFPTGKAAFSLLDVSDGGAVTDKEFPLALVTGAVREHQGTGVRSRRAPGLTGLEPEAWLEVSAKDAADAKLVTGDKVRVVSQHGGAVEVTVRVSGKAPVGVVFLPGFSSDAPVNRLQGREGSTAPAVRLEKL